jgi:hypothetical protein
MACGEHDKVLMLNATKLVQRHAVMSGTWHGAQSEGVHLGASHLPLLAYSLLIFIEEASFLLLFSLRQSSAPKSGKA